MSLVSIGLLTYNHEKYIADALEGILSQNYRPIELIILDDASIDDTPLIIQKYMKRLKEKLVRVIFIQNKENVGNIPCNFNRLIRESKGDFYYSISGDDVLLPQSINLLWETLKKYPECIMVHANMVKIPDSYHFGDEINMNETVWKNKKSQIETDNFFYRLMYRNYILAPTVMRCKKTFYKYGYHDESIAYEDYEYWLRISQNEKIYYLDRTTVLYRKSETSMTNFSGNNYKLQVAMDAVFLTLKKYVQYLNISEQKECWRKYFTDFIQLCQHNQYYDGLKSLEKKMNKIGILLDEPQANKDYLLEIRRKECELLAIWKESKVITHIIEQYLENKNIYHVAIYGYSKLGVMLCDELLNSKVNVDYIIDRKGRMLECSLKVYTLEDSLPPIDAIIVAPIGLYEEIKYILRQKISTEIVDVHYLIKEAVKN